METLEETIKRHAAAGMFTDNGTSLLEIIQKPETTQTEKVSDINHIRPRAVLYFE